ncbi:MAG: hypothetical protein JNL67_00515 [Planctomycetaceae bacterium]|nr:hypothetical protein [Planctomycetaceae bacterium]
MTGQPQMYHGPYHQPHLTGYQPHPAGPQPQGTIYIGFDQPVHVAPHPQAPFAPGVACGTPQHVGYHTAQNGWGWGRRPTAQTAAPAPATEKAKKSRNTLGLIGFVVSLCGLATTALPVAIAGGALSSLALFRRGRFLAVTGLVMALANPAVIDSFEGFKMTQSNRRAERMARVELQRQLQVVNTVLAQAEAQVVAHYDSHDKSWPDGIEGNMLVANTKDPWGSSLRYDEMNDRLVLRSLGPDRKAETGDDVVLTVHHFRENAAATEAPATAP